MYGIGRAEAARFERHSRCFELHSRVLRATQQKGARAVSVTKLKFPHFHPYGSGARPDLSFTQPSCATPVISMVSLIEVSESQSVIRVCICIC
jgi:hypothetical protein